MNPVLTLVEYVLWISEIHRHGIYVWIVYYQTLISDMKENIMEVITGNTFTWGKEK